MGGLEIHDQTFVEAVELHGDFHDFWYDAVLPLARTTVPRYIGSNMSVPSVFETMVSQGTLSRNVMGFKLPQEKEQLGELHIGHTNAYYTDSAKSGIQLPSKDIEVAPGPSPEFIYGGWYTEAVSVKLDAEPGPFSMDLSGYVAVFDMVHPFIILPQPFAKRMEKLLQPGWLWDGIPCEQADELPDLIISLRGRDGEVHDFVMHGRDHLPEEAHLDWVLPKGMCNLFVFGVGTPEPKVPDNIILGSWFWHKFYTVFDADDMMISCAFFHTAPFRGLRELTISVSIPDECYLLVPGTRNI